MKIRPLTRSESELVVSWAAAEGWNPGLHDADIFWETDPDGYVGAELNGELIAAGSIVSYDGKFGFMGFFIVKAELRGQGIGSELWFYRRDKLISRLENGASIGMDGVFDMQSWYARGGFVFSHRNLRMQGVGKKSESAKECICLSNVPFEEVSRYDREHFGFAREKFLRQWIQPKAGLGLGMIIDEQLAGYGVIRECKEGFKIGPLFANGPTVAAKIFGELSDYAAGRLLLLDVPENNSAAMSLAKLNGMEEVFGCARMYYGGKPNLPWPIFNILDVKLAGIWFFSIKSENTNFH